MVSFAAPQIVPNNNLDFEIILFCMGRLFRIIQIIKDWGELWVAFGKHNLVLNYGADYTRLCLPKRPLLIGDTLLAHGFKII